VKITKTKKHQPKNDGEKKPKKKAGKKSAVDQNSAPTPSAERNNDQEPSQNATEAVKEENSQEEGREQKSEKPKKVRKKVCGINTTKKLLFQHPSCFYSTNSVNLTLRNSYFQHYLWCYFNTTSLAPVLF
jgi:hypothetical protein